MKTKKVLILVCLLLVIILVILLLNNKNIIMNSISNNLIRMMNEEPINKETGLINNTFFNINSQGKNAEETTKGINKAIEYANKNNIEFIKFEQGIYLIDGRSYQVNMNETETKKGIILQSNITIDLNNSTFKQIANDKVNYAIFSISRSRKCENY